MFYSPSRMTEKHKNTPNNQVLSPGSVVVYAQAKIPNQCLLEWLRCCSGYLCLNQSTWVQVLALLPFQLPTNTHPGQRQVMAQVPGSLPPTWEDEFWRSGSSPAQLWLLQAFER